MAACSSPSQEALCSALSSNRCAGKCHLSSGPARQLTWGLLDCAVQTQLTLGHCSPFSSQYKSLEPSVYTPTQHTYCCTTPPFTATSTPYPTSCISLASPRASVAHAIQRVLGKCNQNSILSQNSNDPDCQRQPLSLLSRPSCLAHILASSSANRNYTEISDTLGPLPLRCCKGVPSPVSFH